MKTGVRWGVVAWMATVFTVVANSACVPAGTPGDDVSVCTGTINSPTPGSTATWQKFYGGDDEVFLINVTGNAIFALDEAPTGNAATDGNDTFTVRNSVFHWVYGYGGDDRFSIRNSTFNNLYADTNPLWMEQRGKDTIIITNSTSHGYIQGGNDSDTIIIRDSNITYVASGYSYPMPYFRGPPNILYDYTPYDSNDTLLFDHVNFNAPLYFYPAAREGAVEGGKGDDTITFRNGGEAYYVYGGYGNDTITVYDDEHFNACDSSVANTDRCGIYGDESYEDEPNATLIPVLHGNDLITFHRADIRDILVHGGDGSDRVVVEAPVQLSGTEFNGGDDRSVADGFVDQLFFSGWQGDINGSLLRNWEQIVLADDADIRLQDMELNASTESGASPSDNIGYGVTIQEQARLRVDHDATVNARMYNNGTIDLAEDGAAAATLRIEGNYSADQGYLYLDTVLDGSSPGTSDILHITGDTSGTTELRITNLGGSGAKTTGNGILVVEVRGDSQGIFSLQDTPVRVGDFEYTLQKASNGNWYLRSKATRATDAKKKGAQLVEGYVWYDSNMNGKWDGDERAAVQGVTVELIDAQGNIIKTIAPDATGYYRFLLRTSEDYRLHFVLSRDLKEQQYQIAPSALVDPDGYTQPFEADPGSRRSIRIDAAIECGCQNITSNGIVFPIILWWLYLLGTVCILRCRD